MFCLKVSDFQRTYNISLSNLTEIKSADGEIIILEIQLASHSGSLYIHLCQIRVRSLYSK